MGKFSQGLLNDAAILKALDIRSGQAVLDAGCGNGYMAKKFSSRVGSTGTVYALDSDQGAINALKNQCRQTNVLAFAGDITRETELAPASLDLVYLSTVFHIFSGPQVEGFVRETKRILRPGGRLAVVNIKKKETPFGPPVEMRTSPEELIQRLPFVPGERVDAGPHFYMQLFHN